MSRRRSGFLRAVNRLGNALPKPMQRAISDFPGVLWVLERLARNRRQEVTTPEGDHIVFNPLFHSNLADASKLERYEPEVRTALCRVTAPGMVAYDVGANVGVFTLLLSRLVGPRGQVYAFEPERINSSCLQESLRRNGLTNVTLDRRAVGRARGMQRFDRRGGAFSGRLIAENTTYHRSRNVVEVETISLDEIVSEEGFSPPDILKIDVEGNEALVLEGALRILAKHRPVILCEVHTHLGEPESYVWNLLRTLDYSVCSTHDVIGGNVESLPEARISGERHIVAIPAT